MNTPRVHKAKYSKRKHKSNRLYKYLRKDEIPKGLSILYCTVCNYSFLFHKKYIYKPKCSRCLSLPADGIDWFLYLKQFTCLLDKLQGMVVYHCNFCETTFESMVEMDIACCTECCQSYKKKYGIGKWKLYVEYDPSTYSL